MSTDNPHVAHVYVTPEIPDRAREVLEEAGLRVLDSQDSSAEFQALLCTLPTRVNDRYLDQRPALRMVANMAVGTDNIDLEAASERGVLVSNTPDVLTDATADLSFTLLLAAARKLIWADRFVRSGGWGVSNPHLGTGLDISGRTLGIVGAGRIGRAVAERARGFRMNVLLHSRSSGVPLAELLADSDFVSIHTPLTQQTRHLIAEPELRAMKSSAVLINTARGPIVDELALLRALREGWIAAAGLDVFEREPRLVPGLSELPNVVLTPHVGSATVGTRNAMAELAARNIVSFARGEALLTPVSP